MKLTLLFLLLFLSCAEKTHGVVNTISDLPRCGHDAIGLLVYVEQAHQFKLCKSQGWIDINLQGKDGEDGRNGQDGLDSNIDVVWDTTCLKSVNGLLFRHTIVRFSNKMVFTTCSVANAFFQSSSSEFYDDWQPGSMSGGCLVTHDVDSNNSYGYWSFDGSTKRATYKDPTSESDGKYVEFESSDCKDFVKP